MKKIKVIDLLNMLANDDENLPNKIEFQGEYYYLKNDENNIKTYYDEIGEDTISDIFNLYYCLNKELEIIEEDILDEKEKEYLSNVIRPFRNNIAYIVKLQFNDNRKDEFKNNFKEYIEIGYKNGAETLFPYFKVGTMYKGMKLERVYSLEELGL